MALTALTQTAPTKIGTTGVAGDDTIKAALDELKLVMNQINKLQFAVVAGAATATNIAIASILTTATIVAAWVIDFTLNEGAPNTRAWTAPDAVLDEISVTSAGNVQLTTTTTTGKLIFIVYFNNA